MLSFEAGEILEVTGDADANWTVLRRLIGAPQQGLAPTSYIRFLVEPTA